MIGVYDSGVGGLSVWRELVKFMPDEDFIYLADTAYCPYGEKPLQVLRDRAVTLSRFLISSGADMIVVACNTATAAAISLLRSSFPIPFVGMEPAVKPAVQASENAVIGILATANTFKGSLYRDTSQKYAAGVKIIETVGTGLVEAVEQDKIPVSLLERYVGAIKAAGADVIVLGCTHYPFLEKEIKEIAGPEIQVINPAPAVARQTRRIYQKLTVRSGNSIRKFFSTGDISAVRSRAMSIDPTLDVENFQMVSL